MTDISPITWSRDADGVVTLTFDTPNSDTNIVNSTFRRALVEAVFRLETVRAHVSGVILASAKNDFVTGFDVDELYTWLSSGDVPRILTETDRFKESLRRLETLGVPVVAALHGTALGSGWEIALACHHRIGLFEQSARFGLPEVQVGLLPTGAGIARMVRLLGLEQALPLLLRGRKFTVDQAQEIGLIHQVEDSREVVLKAAREWVLVNRDSSEQPWDRPRSSRSLDVADQKFLAMMPAMLHKQTRGSLPAPERVLAAAVEGARVDIETAQLIESRYLGDLASRTVAANMVATFWYGMNAIAAGASRPAGLERHQVNKVGVVGAGHVGSAIARMSALAGASVVLVDATDNAARMARENVAGEIDLSAREGSVTAELASDITRRMTPSTRYEDLAECDLVVESVYENRELKGQVLEKIAAVVSSSAIVASTTSTLPLSVLASHVSRPERFLGIHIPIPAQNVSMIELVRAPLTSSVFEAKAFDFVAKTGKTPIVIEDSRGFLTTRLLVTYALEGAALVADGVEPALIENVARKAGMSNSPLAVADELSLELVWTMGESDRQDDLLEEVDRGRGHSGVSVLDAMVNQLDRRGKANGAGFYDYFGTKRRLWLALAERFGEGGRSVPVEDVRDRLLYAQSLESLRCVSNSIVGSTAEVNVGSILGAGYAPWTGGTLRFITSTGVPEFIARAEELARRYGSRFTPPTHLRRALTSGSTKKLESTETMLQ